MDSPPFVLPLECEFTLVSLSSPMQVPFDTSGGRYLIPYRVPAGTPTRHLCASTWGNRARAAEVMRFCAPPATSWLLTRDASETPAVPAVIQEGCIGVPTASHWRPVCVSWETPPGTPAQVSPQRAPEATPGQHSRSAVETPEGHARDSEKLTVTSRRLIGVPVTSRECPDESPKRHGGDAVSRLSRGAGSLTAPPCRSRPAGTADQPRTAGGARPVPPAARHRSSAGATAGTGMSSARSMGGLGACLSARSCCSLMPAAYHPVSASGRRNSAANSSRVKPIDWSQVPGWSSMSKHASETTIF